MFHSFCFALPSMPYAQHKILAVFFTALCSRATTTDTDDVFSLLHFAAEIHERSSMKKKRNIYTHAHTHTQTHKPLTWPFLMRENKIDCILFPAKANRFTTTNGNFINEKQTVAISITFWLMINFMR